MHIETADEPGMGTRMGTGFRLAYLSGPIDAFETYRNYKSRAASDYFGTIYLAQLFALLEEFEAEALIITTLPKGPPRRQRVDHLTIANIPMPVGKRGAGYHLAMLGWSMRCMREIIRYRADAALLTAGHDYFWLLRPLKFFGIRLMASLHGAPWPKFALRRPHHRVLTWLNGKLFYPACDHIQGVSEIVTGLVRESSPAARAIPRKFLPTYDAGRFADVEMADWPVPPRSFRLLYVGRLEVTKGVFDLVEMMRRLEAEDPGRFELDICGEGNVTEQLKSEIAAAGLDRAIRVHGQCSSSVLARKYADCHAVIVPTQSSLEEGYAKVAAEAVLSLRPVVTSAACPALADIAPAAVEARVDDVDDYVRAIRALASDPDLYAAKVKAAEKCRKIYFDERNSYGAILKIGLESALVKSGQREKLSRDINPRKSAVPK